MVLEILSDRRFLFVRCIFLFRWLGAWRFSNSLELPFAFRDLNKHPSYSSLPAPPLL